MHFKDMVSLVLTVFLCLPSLAGGVAMLVNLVLRRNIEQWGLVSSVSVASAVFIGCPLVAVAAVVSGLVGLSHSVSQRVKYAHYVIVSIAAVVTFSLTSHFGM